MTKPLPRRILSGWRGLGVFWLMVALLLGGGAVWLNRLGPTAPAEMAVAPPPRPRRPRTPPLPRWPRLWKRKSLRPGSAHTTDDRG